MGTYESTRFEVSMEATVPANEAKIRIVWKRLEKFVEDKIKEKEADARL
jgi:hypothetical protein